MKLHQKIKQQNKDPIFENYTLLIQLAPQQQDYQFRHTINKANMIKIEQARYKNAKQHQAY